MKKKVGVGKKSKIDSKSKGVVDKTSKQKSKGVVNKTSKQNSLPIKWFVFAVVVAIILSSIISLIVVGYSSGSGVSLDSGKIIVQINPDLERNGKIIVEVINDDKEVSS